MNRFQLVGQQSIMETTPQGRCVLLSDDDLIKGPRVGHDSRLGTEIERADWYMGTHRKWLFLCFKIFANSPFLSI